MPAKCVKCGIDQDKNPYKVRLYFTNDGYCSVCNAKYKNRPRIKSIFKFTMREVENKHLDSQGRKLTDRQILKNKVYNENRAINARLVYYKEKNKTIRKLEEWL